MAKSNKNKQTKDSNSLRLTLQELGYLLPTSDSELEKFEQIYGQTQVLVPGKFKDADFLFKNDKDEKEVSPVVGNQRSKKSNSDYFKKMVLAAKIADELHEEPTFGRVKFMKVLYLCEHVCDIELTTNYRKFAAGPLDTKFIFSIHGHFAKQKWFKVLQRDSSFGLRYVPDDNIEQYKDYYLGYFNRQEKEIEKLIELFRSMKTSQCEIVATLFAVWKELLDDNSNVNEKSLIEGFYQWNDAKKKFKEKDLLNGYDWMKKNQIVPA